ncbi:MAG: hypothetical protein RL213_189 [Bacteroidota bacterium]|jgi:hypothetical protein
MAKSKRLQPNVDSVEYNTRREHLIISEYGRNVQKMVEHAVTVEDREKRNQLAQTIVNVMGYLNPQLRETVDYKHKLWDHLIIISDFKLDVDSPYPVPTRENARLKPARIAYPSGEVEYKFYGKTMEDMIRRISSMEEGPRKEQFARNLANYMKMSYLTWNKDSVEDTTILSHLEELSGGQLRLAETARLNHTNEMLALSKEKIRENSIKVVRNNKRGNRNKRKK